jgi:hypothetical protein
MTSKGLKLITFLLVIFIIAFPKGGFKVGEIPITNGYLVLAFASLLAIFVNIYNKALFVMNIKQIIIFVSLLFFQIVFFLSIIFNGFSDKNFFIATVVSLGVVPFIFIFLFQYQINKINLNLVLNYISRAVLFVSIYGIFLFFYKYITGDFIEIPYLTVNAQDVGALEGKYIDRGGVYKLISTYNNGNIYGVCILMLLPLYNLIEHTRWKSSIVQVSLILTLSRTVWIGLLLYHILKVILRKKISITKLFNLLFFLIFLVAIIIFIMDYFLHANMNFIFDKNLGGRIGQVESLNIFFFPNKEFSVIHEIVYISILDQLGVLGLFSFILFMVSPLGIYYIHKRKINDPYKQAIFLGMVIYLIVAFSDGAILYIPVMAIYWFLAALLISKNNLVLYNLLCNSK